jgi:hypothetical protein
LSTSAMKKRKINKLQICKILPDLQWSKRRSKINFISSIIFLQKMHFENNKFRKSFWSLTRNNSWRLISRISKKLRRQNQKRDSFTVPYIIFWSVNF